MGIQLIFVVLATLTTVSLGKGKPTIFTCDENDETCTEVSTDFEPTNMIWIVDTGTSFIEHHPKFNLLLISHSNHNFSVGYSDGVMIVFNAITNSVLLMVNGRAHLLHVNKVVMSFSTARDTWRTSKRVYYKEVVPYLRNLRCSRKRKYMKGFDIRSLLHYLYKNGSVNVAPSLRASEKLPSNLEKHFGNIFSLISDSYKSGLATVKDGEAVFYSVALEKNRNNQYLYKWVSSIISNDLTVNNEMVHQLHDGAISENYTEFREYSRLYSIVRYLFTTVEDGSMAYKRGDVNVTVIDKPCNGSKYTAHFARDAVSGNYAINIFSHDGCADTYIIYNRHSWSFYCAITKFILVLPEGKNFGLFNYAAGVGIVACKRTGLATIVKCGKLKKLSKNSVILEGLELMKKLITATRFEVYKKYSFSFSNFISLAYLSGNATNTLCGLACKAKLDINFGYFVENFRAIEAYDPKDESANAVLYFFHGICFRELKDDYKAIVYAIGTRENMLYTSKVVEAIYNSTRDMFAAQSV